MCNYLLISPQLADLVVAQFFFVREPNTYLSERIFHSLNKKRLRNKIIKTRNKETIRMLSTTNLSIALLMAALTTATKLEQPLTLAQLVAQSQEGDCCNSCCCDEPEETPEPEIADPPQPEPDGETEVIEEQVFPEPEQPTEVPELEPDETLEDLFSSADGRPVILDFQYEACDPCASIAPDFE